MGKGSAAVTVTLKLPKADGQFSMQVKVPRGPMRLRDLVPIAQRISLHNVDHSLALEKKAGRRVSCKRGCAACCRQIVPISAPEAFRLADHVLSLDARTRERALGRIDAVESEIQAAGLLSELEALAAGEPCDMGATARRYFEQKIACPFLHEESCSVHSERPLVCRNYFVTTPAELCSTPHLSQIRTVPMPPVLSPALSGAAAALTGGPPLMIPLSIAMQWVDAHADWGFLEWPGVTAVGELLRALGIPEAAIAAIG
jgi:Fe-S-cluster containining protein